ncbi:alpha/beta fold hydrolase [Nocardia terpenica]|uniref:alpha/beta fold hydrolase n=1 Tax=Nocardia terpenica TaxID=455432 RepID=UPI001558B9B1|nr:alpha/beta hydrolase [Nocardia terpenica]NQE93503.1 alpha/beta hydrolase [Nocardia terpenica]
MSRIGHAPWSAPALQLGRHYSLDGRKLFLCRSGSGGPSVVFVPGAGGVGLDWWGVQRRVARWTTSVVYDRGGTGWSDRLELPRPATDIAIELRDLLRKAEIPGPYVLVAHSLGGAYARRFGQLFPHDVAALLALDVITEEWDRHMPDTLKLRPQPMPGATQLRLLSLSARLFYRKMFSDWPDPPRTMLVAAHASMEWNLIAAAERSNQDAVIDEIRSGGPFPDVPMITVAALGVDLGMRLYYRNSATLRQLTEAKQRLYTTMADSTPQGEYRSVPNASHSTIHIDAADDVAQAIRDLLDRAVG